MGGLLQPTVPPEQVGEGAQPAAGGGEGGAEADGVAVAAVGQEFVAALPLHLLDAEKERKKEKREREK